MDTWGNIEQMSVFLARKPLERREYSGTWEAKEKKETSERKNRRVEVWGGDFFLGEKRSKPEG